jgi:O-acetylhomoserine (thiol)-lyase
VASSSLYGGTFNLLNTTLPRLITTTFVDPSDATNFTKQLKKIQSIFAESLENPKLDVLDLKAIAAESKLSKFLSWLIILLLHLIY